MLDRSMRLDERIARVASPALAGIDEQLNGLRMQLRDLRRPLSDRASTSNGYHSAIHPRPDELAWVQLDLGMTVPIDEIRLVPARPTDFPDTPGFGFPPRFHVEVSDDPSFRRSEQVAVAIRPDKPNAVDEPYVIRPGAGRRGTCASRPRGCGSGWKTTCSRSQRSRSFRTASIGRSGPR